MNDKEIKICPGQDEDIPREIKICPGQDEDIPREIKICPADPPKCEGLPPLTLVGSDAPSVGSTYAAGGGSGEYFYNFDGGSISSSGVVLSITECGGSDGNGAVGSVSVTDSCGNSKSIVVRLTGGTWVFGSDTDYNGTDCCESSDGSRFPGRHHSGSCTVISGGTMVSEYWQYICDDPLRNICTTSACTSADKVVNRIIINFWECV